MKNLLRLLFFLFLITNLHAQSDCFSVEFQVFDESCPGDNDGEIFTYINGGVAPYEFLWSTGDSTAHIDSLSPGNYMLTVTNALGCEVVLGSPSLLDSLVLLPDGSGTSVVLQKEIDWFPNGQIIEEGADIEICVVMEHSWLRDLEIELSCPDGTTVVLHDHPGQFGNGVYLGEPVMEGNGTVIPGVGYQYCWTMEATSTWLETANSPNDITTLPAGDYRPEESFDNLIGCPLNGLWSIEIFDLWPGDNGVIFDWSMNIKGRTSSLGIRNGAEDCTSCYEEYYCMDWLRDTIRHNILGEIDFNESFAFVQKAHWGNRTIFAMWRLDVVDYNYVAYYDCSGYKFYAAHGMAAVAFTNNNYFSVEDISDIETIWTWGGVLEDCAALALDTVIVPMTGCFDDENDGLCANAVGGFPPYIYHWVHQNDTLTTDGCLGDLSDGIYTLIIEDLNGHTTEPTEVEVSIPDEIVINIELTPDSLGYNCIPQIVVEGGVPPYTIEWHYYAVIDRIIVDVSDANGCEQRAMADCTIIGTNDIESSRKLSVFPNPGTGVFTVLLQNESHQAADLQVWNIMGQLVFSDKMKSGSKKISIDLSGLAKGVYWLEWRQENERLIRKLIVE